MWVVKSAVLGWNRLLLPTSRDRRPMLQRGIIDGGVERAVMRDEWCERQLNRREHNDDFSEREFALSARLRQQSGREALKVNEAAEQLAPHNRFFQRMQCRSLPRRRRAKCCTANVVSPED